MSVTDSTTVVNNESVDYESYTERELLERIARQNDEIVSLLGQGIGALQSFQSGPMGAMVGKIFGGK